MLYKGLYFRWDVDHKRIQPTGVNYGNDLEVLARKGALALCRVRGSNQWVGIGLRDYFPTRYMVIEIKPVENDLGVRAKEKFDVLEEVEAGRLYRKVVRELREKYHFDQPSED